MSKKTLRKRIALATVAALGAGVLSLVSGPAAQADTRNTSTTATASYGWMNLATTASTTGAGVTTSAGQASNGLLSYSDISGTSVPWAGTTQTATMLSTGSLVFYTTPGVGSATAVGSVKFVVSAGGYIAGATGPSVSQDLKSAAMTAAVGVANASIAVKPTTGSTSFTVSLYLSSAADTAASLLAGTNSGTLTLVGQANVTVAASDVSGVLAPAKSGVFYTGVTGSSNTWSGTLTADSSTLTSPGAIAYGGSGYLNIRARDAYGNALTGAGLLQATATNGAYIAFGASSGGTGYGRVAAAGKVGTDYVSVSAGASADDYALEVQQPSSAPLSTTVTISWNGTVIGSKTFGFAGKIAKITLSSAVNGKTNDSTSGRNIAIIAFADAAGNTVYPTASQVGQDGTGYNSVVTTVSMTTTPSATAVGYVTFGCGPNAGSAKIAMTYTNTDGTVVTSNSLPVTCSGDAVSYTAAYDKSTYKPGDVATLTITFKDSKGNLANDYTSPNAGTAGAISVGGLTAITSPAITANGAAVLTNGTLTYRYSVGTTNGTFTNTVTFSTTDTAATNAGLTASGPQTVSLTIADGSTTLNDVLKGIVSLIASINKQIAALAKLVTKKK